MKYRLTFDLDLTEEDVREAVEDFQRLLGIEPGSLPFEELAERDFRREFSTDEDMQRLVTNFSIRKVEDIEDPAGDASNAIEELSGEIDDSDLLEIVRAILDEADVYVGDSSYSTLKRLYPDPEHWVWSRVVGSRG